MPHRVHLEQPPIGVAAASGRGGENLPVCYREFTSSEDGDTFVSRLEGFPAMILSQLSAELPVKPSAVDHLVALVQRSGTTDVYINELVALGKVRLRRSVQKGDAIFDSDIVDIEELRFEGLEVPPDVGILILFSQGWRKGLYFDFGPLLPEPITRTYELPRLLGSLFSYLTFQRYFKIQDDDWRLLFSQGWFPFIGIDKDALTELLTHIRNGWDTDELVPKLVYSINAKSESLRESWTKQALLASHLDLLTHALNRFRAGDHVSATAILYPRIEGMLRDIHASTGGTTFTQSHLSEAPLRAALSRTHEYSRLLPARFREFLKAVYFSSFAPGQEAPLSRNSVAHGVAPSGLFSAKSAALGILVVDQLCFHLPPSNETGSSGEAYSF